MNSFRHLSRARGSLLFSSLVVSRALQTGIVGLPNVGKSSLFNALVGSTAAQAANFPFCTIEPNFGLVHVQDSKLNKIASIYKSESIIPTQMEFVDIAGIVKGASEGAGLGNKFLSNIRMTDAICHVVRCFVNDDIIHVDTTVDPIRDIEVINLELILADLVQIEKRLEKAKRDKKCSVDEIRGLEKANECLTSGIPVRLAGLTDGEKDALKSLMLLTQKPVIYALNVADNDLASGNDMTNKVNELARKEGCKTILVSAQVESELVLMDAEDRQAFLRELRVDEERCGLSALVRAAYASVGLQTFYTAGAKEARAWTIRRGMSAPQAAGVIHTDFEKGFIRAEVVSYEQLLALGSEKAVRDSGLVRSEGKEYIMQEGDIVNFRFNV